MIFALCFYSAMFVVGIAIPRESCHGDLNRGHWRCSNRTRAIKYYFDKELDTCLPFLYEGCGGGANHWNDVEFCIQRCKPADRGTCGGGARALASCSTRNRRCPLGSSCYIMAFGNGLCCNDRIQQAWRKEHHPKCLDSGFTVVTEPVWYGEQPLLGKSCEHKFCPFGSKCVPGRWLAHCCQPIKSR
ncbi:unnamed protein product [Caenorhabditis bovis]|uniref:BPTI/Kunitz inhibitor domain-containing protein n=1 Tax=Caenorhabditis bovis TaxID=2654633 RepID=A0A8S1ED44_9PELO|nr:unnamed protein product [Caenorhabditis bovis]